MIAEFLEKVMDFIGFYILPILIITLTIIVFVMIGEVLQGVIAQ